MNERMKGMSGKGRGREEAHRRGDDDDDDLPRLSRKPKLKQARNDGLRSQQSILSVRYESI